MCEWPKLKSFCFIKKAMLDETAKSPRSWRCNEIKLVVASHPNKLQAFNTP